MLLIIWINIIKKIAIVGIIIWKSILLIISFDKYFGPRLSREYILWNNNIKIQKRVEDDEPQPDIQGGVEKDTVEYE